MTKKIQVFKKTMDAPVSRNWP